MERKAAKELLHIQGWLGSVDEIVERGKDAYLADDLLQEAGDSLMMKLGEAAAFEARRRRAEVPLPGGHRSATMDHALEGVWKEVRVLRSAAAGWTSG